MTDECIFAHTDLTDTSLPDYINIVETEEGKIVITVRGEGITANMMLPRIALRQLVLSCAGVSIK